MTRIYAPRPSEVFVLSEANGFQSRDEILLKENADAYGVGEIVVAEYTETTPSSGNFDHATGKFVRLTSTILGAYDTVDLSVVLRTVDASAADTPAAGFSRNGEIKAREIDLPSGVTLAALKPHLDAQGIIVR